MADRDEQEHGGLRVVDKRRFTSEGESRDASEETGASSSQRTAASRRAESKPEPIELGRQSVSGQPQESANQELPPVDFSSFIVSLATQALVMLGEIPNPESNARHFNREAAHHTIDIIALLEEKTAGNLSDDEANLIGEVLTSLRLAFVKKVKEHDHP